MQTNLSVSENHLHDFTSVPNIVVAEWTETVYKYRPLNLTTGTRLISVTPNYTIASSEASKCHYIHFFLI